MTEFMEAAIASAVAIYNLYKSVVLLKFPYAIPFVYGCHATYVAVKIEHMQHDKAYFWFHSLLLCILSAVAGGSVASMFIGKMPALVTNDLIVLECVAAWYLTHRLHLTDFFDSPYIQPIWQIGASLYKTYAITYITHSASSYIAPGPYYHIPLVGPIIVGTTMGSFSAFFPLDKGLKPVYTGVPWAIQSAFFSALFFHIAVHDDKGPFGAVLTMVFGDFDEYSARVVVGTFLVGSTVVQLIYGPDYSLLTPVFAVWNSIFKTPEVDPKKGLLATLLSQFLSSARILIVIAAVGLQLYISSSPRTSLSVSQTVPLFSGPSLVPRRLVGSCQLGSAVRACTPFALQATAVDGSLSLQVDGKGPKVWTLSTPLANLGPAAALSSTALRIGGDGAVRVVIPSDNNKAEVLLWTSSSSCTGAVPTEASTGASKQKKEWPELRLDEATGFPLVYCPNGAIVPVA